MKYKGPAKPIPTHIEIVSDKAERIIFFCLPFTWQCFFTWSEP